MSGSCEGIITGLIAGYYDVATEKGTIRTRARGNFRQQKLHPQVGDRVEISLQPDDTGYLLAVKPRQNLIGRPQVANVDRVLLVISAREPDFSLTLLDRFLTFFAWRKVAVTIYLSKGDLLPEAELKQIKQDLAYYQRLGYPVFFQKKELLQNLSQLSAQIWTLAGQTGAGKSTLLNYLLPQAHQTTAAISQSLNRGRHTTRKVELFKLKELLIADTPGFSAIDFGSMPIKDLKNYFLDFVNFADGCKFRSCQHLQEPACAVKKAWQAGKIAPWRYQHYLNIRQEIKDNRMPEYLK